MENYLVRQPILDDKKNVFAYEVLWRDDRESESQKDAAAAQVIEDFFYELTTKNFLDNNLTVMTFTPNLLMKNIPKMFDPEKLIIQIDDSVLVHPLAQKIIYRYKKQGYQVAITGFEFAARFFGVLDIVDYIKVDFSNPSDPSLENVTNLGKSFKIKVIAYNVNTPESFDKAKELGCTYIQGASVAEQFTSRVHRMDHMQSNFFQLMVAITKDEPDLDEISEIISRDVTLAFSLIKLVNSAYFALRNQAKSVKQALIVLGLGQLKEWVYLLSFKDGGNIYPEELIRVSFLRARFCSGLSPYIKDLPISRSEAYLMGMFSTLGSLMEVPLDYALAELPLAEEIKTALITGEGMCGDLYALVKEYENANWKGITTHAEKLGIPMNVITREYFDCVEYVNGIWKELHAPNEDK